MKWLTGITLALLLSGCGGGSTTGEEEMPGKVLVQEESLGINTLGEMAVDKIVVLQDSNETEEMITEITYNGEGEEVARVIFSKGWELQDKEGKNKCECKVTDPCTPCKVTISRSCGSSINTTERLAEAQPDDDTKMALLGATYDISINRDIVAGDAITSGIEVKLKIPLCLYDEVCKKYYDFKDGEVHYIKVWIQPVDSGEAGYWLTPNPEIVDGEITFTVNTPLSHMALFGIVDKCISGSSS